MLLISYLTILSVVALTTSALEGDKLKLQVLHESKCPDSKRFFLEQLRPTYEKIGQIIDLSLVPFGHARTIKPDMMICQHGSRECNGNRLMACVQTYGKDMRRVVETIACLFDGRQSEKDCITKNMPNVSFGDIDKCRTSVESFKLMEEFEAITGKVGYVPTIKLNGLYSEEIQEGCENRLLEYLCENYNGTKPEACKNSS